MVFKLKAVFGHFVYVCATEMNSESGQDSWVLSLFLREEPRKLNPTSVGNEIFW